MFDHTLFLFVSLSPDWSPDSYFRETVKLPLPCWLIHKQSITLNYDWQKNDRWFIEFCGARLCDTEGANFHSLPTVRGWTKYILRTQKFPFFSLKQSHHNEILNVVIFFNFFLYNTAVTIPGCSKSPHYYDIIDLMHMSSYNRLAWLTLLWCWIIETPN